MHRFTFFRCGRPVIFNLVDGFLCSGKISARKYDGASMFGQRIRCLESNARVGPRYQGYVLAEVSAMQNLQLQHSVCHRASHLYSNTDL